MHTAHTVISKDTHCTHCSKLELTTLYRSLFIYPRFTINVYPSHKRYLNSNVELTTLAEHTKNFTGAEISGAIKSAVSYVEEPYYTEYYSV